MEKTFYEKLKELLENLKTEDIGNYELKELTSYQTALNFSDDFAFKHNGVNCIHFIRNEHELIDIEYIKVFYHHKREVYARNYNFVLGNLKDSMNSILGVSL